MGILGGATEHIKALEDAIRAWRDAGPYRVDIERNDERTRIGFRIAFLKLPDLTRRWALLAGDAVHNMRAALDHAVYAVAVHENGGRPPANARHLEFPITDSVSLFAKRAWRIETLSCSMRTRIESAQPYNRMREGFAPVLSILRDFDDSDKHRLLRVALAFPLEQELDEIAGLDPDQSIDFRVHVGAVVDGTEIASLTFDRPSLNVNFKYGFSLAVGIGHGWKPLGYRRYVLLQMLGVMMGEVQAVLAHLSGEPLAPPTHVEPLDWPPSGEYTAGQGQG